MDVFLIVITLLWGAGAWASPPADLSDFDGTKGGGSKGKQKTPAISEREMIYVDNQENVNSGGSSVRELRYNVVGRDRPGRDGKGLLKLSEKQRVKFVRRSKDNRWTLIEVPATQKKAWIPSAALVEKE